MKFLYLLGYVYYWNSETEASVWEQPGLDYYRNLYTTIATKQEPSNVHMSTSLSGSHSKEAWSKVVEKTEEEKVSTARVRSNFLIFDFFLTYFISLRLDPKRRVSFKSYKRILSL